MPDSIINQCKRLYIDAFHDDEQFTDLLFDLFYDSSCRYLCENGNVVSMLFAIDISIDNFKGKYVYAVVTDEKYRGKGYMRRLFDSISMEFKGHYDFLCLRPMNESLFDFYSRLGFVNKLKKSTVHKNRADSHIKLFSLTNITDIKQVRKRLLGENYAEYCNDFYKLLLSYCDIFTDDTKNPKLFTVREKQSGKVKEVLGDYNLLPDEFLNTPLFIPGQDFDFATVKILKEINFEDKYLGFALD